MLDRFLLSDPTALVMTMNANKAYKDRKRIPGPFRALINRLTNIILVGLLVFTVVAAAASAYQMVTETSTILSLYSMLN